MTVFTGFLKKRNSGTRAPGAEILFQGSPQVWRLARIYRNPSFISIGAGFQFGPQWDRSCPPNRRLDFISKGGMAVHIVHMAHCCRSASSAFPSSLNATGVFGAIYPSRFACRRIGGPSTNDVHVGSHEILQIVKSCLRVREEY